MQEHKRINRGGIGDHKLRIQGQEEGQQRGARWRKDGREGQGGGRTAERSKVEKSQLQVPAVKLLLWSRGQEVTA